MGMGRVPARQEMSLRGLPRHPGGRGLSAQAYISPGGVAYSQTCLTELGRREALNTGRPKSGQGQFGNFFFRRRESGVARIGRSVDVALLATRSAAKR